MDRINGAGTIDLGGGKRGFRDENLATGIEGSEVTAAWLNAVQEELLSVIEAGGQAASSANLGQMLKVLRGGRLIYGLTAGTSTALTLTLPGTAELVNGLIINAKIHVTTGTPLTLNVNGLGAVPVRAASGLAVPAGLFVAGDMIQFGYMDGEFRVLSLPPGASVAETIDGTLINRFVTPFSLRGALSNLFQTAPVTVYVRTDGNDANDGSANTAAKAFLTIQGAINTLYQTYGRGRPFDIRLGLAGSYAAPTDVPIGTSVSVTGNVATPQNYIISSGAAQNVFYAQSNSIALSGVTFRGNNSGCKLVEAFAGGYLTTNSCRWESTVTPNSLVRASGGGYIAMYGTNTIATGAAYCLLSLFGGVIAVGNAPTFTFSGSPAFTAVAGAFDLGVIFAQTGVFSGTVTGQRYFSINNSLIQTGGGGANFFPGSTAGTTSNGGLYA